MLENALFCRQNARLKNCLFWSKFWRQNLSKPSAGGRKEEHNGGKSENPWKLMSLTTGACHEGRIPLSATPGIPRGVLLGLWRHLVWAYSKRHGVKLRISTFFSLIFDDLICRLQEKQKHCKCSAKVIFALTTVKTKEKRDQTQADITRERGNPVHFLSSKKNTRQRTEWRLVGEFKTA